MSVCQYRSRLICPRLCREIQTVPNRTVVVKIVKMSSKKILSENKRTFLVEDYPANNEKSEIR